MPRTTNKVQKETVKTPKAGGLSVEVYDLKGKVVEKIKT